MATPRFATARNPDRPTRGHKVAEAARGIGRPLRPHQREIADVFGEYDPDTGAPIYDELRLILPRRGGKTGLALAELVERMRRRPRARAFYSAQTQEDAMRILRDEWAPIVQASPLRDVLRFRFSRGDAAMFVQIGGRRLSRTEIYAPNAGALHGRDSDLTVQDECWSFTLDAGRDLEAGLRPARWARPDGQILYLSAGGTESSTWLNELVDGGRKAPPGVAYFEYSADPEDPNYDPYDEELWWEVHPGLAAGLVSIDKLRQDARTVDRAELERSLLCVWPRAAGTTLLAGWEDLLDPTAAPSGPIVLAFDVHPSRSSAAIVAAGAGVAELVDHGPGVGWLEDRLAELADRHDVIAVVRDPSGPAGATNLDDLDDLLDVTAGEVAAACGWLVDAIDAGDRLRIRTHPAIAAAFAGARTYNRGDGRTVWARRTSTVDLTPLYALTLAAWCSSRMVAGTIY